MQKRQVLFVQVRIKKLCWISRDLWKFPPFQTWAGCYGSRGNVQTLAGEQVLQSSMHHAAYENSSESFLTSKTEIFTLSLFRSRARRRNATGKINRPVVWSLIASSSIDCHAVLAAVSLTLQLIKDFSNFQLARQEVSSLSHACCKATRALQCFSFEIDEEFSHHMRWLFFVICYFSTIFIFDFI